MKVVIQRVGMLLVGAVFGLAATVEAQGPPPIVWFGPGHATVQSCAVSPEGEILATASLEDETIKLWDTGTGTLIRTLAGAYAGIFSIAFTPDGQYVASGGDTAITAAQPRTRTVVQMPSPRCIMALPPAHWRGFP